MKTIWSADLPSFGKLRDDISVDTAIIGGGLAGLWCAYHLVRAGKKVCVLEARKVGSGVTMGSTAILTYAQDVIMRPLIKKHGEDVAFRYLSDTKDAMEEIAKLVKKEKIDCDFEPIKYILFSTKGKGKRALKKEFRAYEKLGQKVKKPKEINLPYRAKLALEVDAYQFDPLKLCAWLANFVAKNGGQIYEGAIVREAPDGNSLRVGVDTVTADNFIVATHFPYINKAGFYWLKMYQDMNYCLSFKADSEFADFCKGTSYESIDQTGFEYRRVGNDILIDGASFKVGAKQYKSKYKILEKHITKHFGEFESLKETARYSAQDCITLDKLPYAGRYSHFADNVFVVTGFNKWGMSNSYITAKVVNEMILGKLDRNAGFNENIYSPQRFALFVNPVETAGHVATVVASFANDLLNLDTKKFERIKPGQGAIIKYRGHRVGASRDDKGKVHLISGICSHLGCNLKWNKDDFSFDCPCHGSRFDHKGNILNGPAVNCCKTQALGANGNCCGQK